MGRKFATTHGLEHDEDLFEKAALVARDPDGFASIKSLTPAEQDALAYERDHKWSCTKTLIFTMFVCALGAAVQGWDQTGSNGANLSFPVEFGLTHPDPPKDCNAPLQRRAGPAGGSGQSRGDWIVGIINAAPYLAAAIPGVWLSDPLNHYFGRRGEIFSEFLLFLSRLVCRRSTDFVQSPPLSSLLPRSAPPSPGTGTSSSSFVSSWASAWAPRPRRSLSSPLSLLRRASVERSRWAGSSTCAWVFSWVSL